VKIDIRCVLISGALALGAGSAIAQQPVVLKFSSPAPVASYLHPDAFTPWAAAVTQASGGTLKVDTFYGGTLGNFGVTYDRVVDGVADIGFILAANAAGKFKEMDVVGLPFEAKTGVSASVSLWNMFEKGVIAGAFDQVKPLAMWTFPNSAIHSKMPIKTLDEFKGKKMAASSAVSGKVIVALGGAQLTFRPDETYQAISRGVADGTLMPFTGAATFKINEVVKFHLDTALGSDAALIFMNKKKYESLPPQAKAAIDRFSYLGFSEKLGRLTDEQWAEKRELVKDTIAVLSAQEEARWKKMVSPVAADWAKETPNGQKVLAAFRAEVAAYEARARRESKGGK
jgi:TRAP-type C4-dicarboxylate transport system substrate-binding protein